MSTYWAVIEYIECGIWEEKDQTQVKKKNTPEYICENTSIYKSKQKHKTNRQGQCGAFEINTPSVDTYWTSNNYDLVPAMNKNKCVLYTTNSIIHIRIYSIYIV